MYRPFYHKKTTVHTQLLRIGCKHKIPLKLHYFIFKCAYSVFHSTTFFRVYTKCCFVDIFTFYIFYIPNCLWHNKQDIKVFSAFLLHTPQFFQWPNALTLQLPLLCTQLQLLCSASLCSPPPLSSPEILHPLHIFPELLPPPPHKQNEHTWRLSAMRTPI